MKLYIDGKEEKMKKITGLLLIILLITNLGIGYSEDMLLNSEVNMESVFTDLENYWGTEDIMALYNRGGINGYPDGTFRPDKAITKVEFLALVAQTVALNEVEVSKDGEHWGKPIVKWAYEKEIVEISDLDELTWDNHITRYDMAKIIVRSLENIIGEAAVDVSGVEEIMVDYDAVNKTRAAYYVKQAFAKGIITGKTEEGLFAGNDTGTRAEAATLVWRLLNPEVRINVTIDNTTEAEEEVVIPDDVLFEEFVEAFIEGAIDENNHQRALQGVGPLERDNFLVEIAQYKSDDMVMLAKAGETPEVYFSHESPTYGDLRDLANLFDLSKQKSIGENLAWMPYAPVDATPEALGEKAILLLKTSTSHYQAMIDEKYFKIGIGVSYYYYDEYNTGYLFITQTFSN